MKTKIWNLITQGSLRPSCGDIGGQVAITSDFQNEGLVGTRLVSTTPLFP